VTARGVLVGHDQKGGRVSIDLDTLLRTRLLIQANSGGGKSWLLRRLAEQLFGRIPVIIIDPEGEFATLRERYGYALAAKDGDTPAIVRSAELLAQRLLELRASAVCDLYEMKQGERHEWVAKFLNALIDAPKKLWQPLIVIVDEAHLFCPEKGAGESVASEAMTALTTRGRKRGYCAIWATQRLAKLRKDAAAELQNVLIGSTFMDADRDRAADALGVARADRKEFFDQIKLLPEGNFFGLGRAIALDRVLVKVGAVETTHAEPGRHSAAPPPPPEKVRALLPKLADLPAEAEAKERTLAEAKVEIGRLKRELVEAKRANPAPVAKVETKVVERSVVKAADLKRAEKLIERLSRIQHDAVDVANLAGERSSEISKAIQLARGSASQSPAAAPAGKSPDRAPAYDPALMKAHTVMGSRAPSTATFPHQGPFREVELRPTSPPARRGSPSTADATLGKAERAILSVLAQHPQGCTAGKLALLSGYRWSGGFRNSLASLRTSGFMVGSNGGTMQITETGFSALGDYDPLPRGQALIDYWLNHPSLGTCERAVLKVLVKIYPKALVGPDLAVEAGYQWSGGFRNSLGSLRTAGVIVGTNMGGMTASEELFS